MIENVQPIFRPQEIVCIDGGELRLFAEVIQPIPARNRCWAKPLMLAQQAEFQMNLLHDLRESAQLILPLKLFRSAIDTEVLPLMTELFQLEKIPNQAANTAFLSRQALHQFVSTLSIESSLSINLMPDTTSENHHHDARN